MAWGRRRYRKPQQYRTPAPKPEYGPIGQYPTEPAPIILHKPSDRTMPEGELATEFSTWGSFVEYVEKNASTSRLKDSISNPACDAIWYGSKTFAHALELARNGQPEQCEKIQRLLAPIVDKLTSLVERQVMFMDVYSPMGLYDMSAVAQNLPENAYNFVTRYEDEKGLRVIRLVVNVTCSSRVESEALAIRGAVIAGVVNALELSGTRCEVVLAYAISSYDTAYKHTHLYVTLKQANDDLDLPLLAYQLCSSSVHRRLIFRFQEIHGNTDSTYGIPIDVPNDKRGDIYFMATHASRVNWYEYMTPENALRYIREQLKTQNIHLSE